ncbi:hypothetical protein HanPI659440_Chr01g0000561 [Helianthus annuus]|nr:hypothetical protein HanPI659440_Chr01g0000561 [Helianthus annuus]
MRGRSPVSRQQKQQVAAAMDSDNCFRVKRTEGAGDRLTGGDDGGGRQTWGGWRRL